MQTLEDTAAQWAYAAADQAVSDHWAWVQQYWGGATLPPLPPVRWAWDPWALALLVVLGPRLVTAGVPATTVTPWIAAQGSGRMPAHAPGDVTWSRPMREYLQNTVGDVQARLDAWAQDIRQTVMTGVTGAKRAGLTLAILRQGLADHFTGWGQDLQRLVQTELSAARAEAILETARADEVRVVTQPGACAVCHAAFDGRVFRLLKTAPTTPAAQAQTALWPGKWTLNWNRRPADQWPAVPRHPRCRCRVVPVPRPVRKEEIAWNQ
jgi:hypothetical protein